MMFKYVIVFMIAAAAFLANVQTNPPAAPAAQPTPATTLPATQAAPTVNPAVMPAAQATQTQATPAPAPAVKPAGAVVDRLLNPDNPAVTLHTMEKAAGAVNRRLSFELKMA